MPEITGPQRVCPIIHWQARRGAQGSTLRQCIQEAEDLGRRAHVVKVLLKSFSGANEEGDAVVWPTPSMKLVMRPEQVERATFVDFEVHLGEVSAEEAATKLSPRFRKLADSRSWIVFDTETSHALVLAPPKRAPRRKKGLVTIPIDVDKVLRELAATGTARILIIGGLVDIAALDNFLDRSPTLKEMPDLDYFFSWTNHEVRLPSGSRFFSIDFRGPAADFLFDWYCRMAKSSGLDIASIADKHLRIETKDEVVLHDLSECHLFLHNVWGGTRR